MDPNTTALIIKLHDLDVYYMVFKEACSSLESFLAGSPMSAYQVSLVPGGVKIDKNQVILSKKMTNGIESSFLYYGASPLDASEIALVMKELTVSERKKRLQNVIRTMDTAIKTSDIADGDVIYPPAVNVITESRQVGTIVAFKYDQEMPQRGFVNKYFIAIYEVSDNINYVDTLFPDKHFGKLVNVKEVLIGRDAVTETPTYLFSTEHGNGIKLPKYKVIKCLAVKVHNENLLLDQNESCFVLELLNYDNNVLENKDHCYFTVDTRIIEQLPSEET